MNGPSDADPFILRRSVLPAYPYITFDPSNRWVVVNYTDSLAFWPINRAYPYVLQGKVREIVEESAVTFTRDGKQLAVADGDGSIRVWDLNNLQAGGRNLRDPSDENPYLIDSDPFSRYLAIASYEGPFVISLADGNVHRIPGEIGAGAVSFSPDGRFLAAESSQRLIVWDLESDHVKDLNYNKKLGRILRVRFSSDGSLFSGTENGSLYQSNVKTGTYKLVAKGNKHLDSIVTPKNAPHLVICLWIDALVDLQKARSELRVIDVRTGKSYSDYNAWSTHQYSRCGSFR